MDAILKRIVIWWYKRQARKLYTLYYKRLLTYTCSSELAEVHDPDLLRYRMDFNRAIDRLKHLDPAFCSSTLD